MKLRDVDLNDLDAFERETPHEQFKVLRNEAPVHWHAGAPDDSGYWCITKHADLQLVSKQPQLFSSEARGALMRDPDEASLAGLRLIMLNMDPPRHRQYRAIINKAFTPRMVRGLERAVDRMIDDIIDDVIEKGACDFVDALAAPLPMGVICEMMGVPQDDRRTIYELANKLVGFDDPEYQEIATEKQAPDIGSEYEAASAEMFMYAAKLADRTRSHPRNDLRPDS